MQRQTTVSNKHLSHFIKNTSCNTALVIVGLALCFSSFAGVKGKLNLSESYLQTYSGKTTVEIPEILELIEVVFALTEYGLSEKSKLINKDSDYYQRVLTHFLKFKNHSAINAFNRKMVSDESNPNSKTYVKNHQIYVNLKNNSVYLKINNQGQLEFNKDLITVSSAALLPKELKLLQDFINDSQFLTFYQQNKPYYQQLIGTYQEKVPLQKMISWLKQHFDSDYDSYRVFISDLTGGTHSTTKINDGSLNQTLMFVSSTSANKNVQNIMGDSRVVFTEIDHNFVNPTSDLHLEQINKAFSNRSVWANSENQNASAYKTPYKVFNEYMTWAVFSLYLYDHYPQNEVEEYIKKMESQMASVSRRGFSQFEAFNQKLISLYQASPKNTKAADLYPQMLSWSLAVNSPKPAKQYAGEWQTINRKLLEPNQANQTSDVAIENELRFNQKTGLGLAYAKDLEIEQGTIEVEIRGGTTKERNFLGLLFRGENQQHFDAVYFRPYFFNHSDKKLSRRAIQYISHPQHKFQKLRRQYPDEYETQLNTDTSAGEWFHVKLELIDKKVKVFIDHSDQAAAEFNLLSKAKSGKVGLFMGTQTAGHFRNFKYKNVLKN